MKKAQAYRLGITSGYEAGIYGDFTAEELSNEDAFVEAAAEICENKRQYADSPTYEFARPSNSEGLFDAFDETPNADADLAGEVERFMEASGFRHQLVVEGFTAYFKDTLQRHGLRLAAIQQRGSCLKIRVSFPPQHTPSKKFKLSQQMHVLIRESGYKARRLWLVVNKRRVSMWIVPQSD